ncbi:MAG: outer membrane beta-barrel protein [Chitinophagaceae bacterium]
MKRIFIGIALLAAIDCEAQDSATQSKPVISGSIDAYYRYNFANPKSGTTNNLTSFTNSQNSFELGMAGIRADHSSGKVSGTIDLGFGRRAEEFSYNDGDTDNNRNGFLSLSNIKQLYISYSPSQRLKFTAGKWGTHIGYEMVDAYLNRNYSMSYLFSYGPFFHTGIKADISTAGKTAMMAGIANPTDYSTTTRPAKFIIGQLSTATANDKLKAYLNYQGGNYATGSRLDQLDLVLSGAISSRLSVAYNGTVQFRNPQSGPSGNWWGSALYINYDPAANCGFTLRGEYVSDADGMLGLDSKILALTLSNNIRLGSLTIIPELRYDQATETLFEKNNGNPSKSTFTGLLAAVYRF